MAVFGDPIAISGQAGRLAPRVVGRAPWLQGGVVHARSFAAEAAQDDAGNVQMEMRRNKLHLYQCGVNELTAL